MWPVLSVLVRVLLTWKGALCLRSAVFSSEPICFLRVLSCPTASDPDRRALFTRVRQREPVAMRSPVISNRRELVRLPLQ